MKCNYTLDKINETLLNVIMAENELQHGNTEATDNSDTTDDTLYQQFLDVNNELNAKLNGLSEDFETFLNILSESDQVWKLWNQYIHFDAFFYISLWLSIRQGNWALRNAALKGMAPIFHAFDRTYYLKIIPQHLEDMLKCPRYILKQFENGGFVLVSLVLSGHQLLLMKLMRCLSIKI